tara:strand:- start:753 stop:1334 length:582 start_codon:yes stop_codon:yes gene_type:complete
MEGKKKEVAEKPDDCGCGVTRRQVMVGAAVGTAALAASGLVTGKPAIAGTMDGYPRKLVGTVSGLQTDQPQVFTYPQDSPSIFRSALIKLGIPAADGVGPEGDIVAFNGRCPHQGGELVPEDDTLRYDAASKTLGPCPWHLSTFDASNEGMITSAHSTQNLPQVVLEVEGDNIYAVGMKGLIYGMPANLMKVS